MVGNEETRSRQPLRRGQHPTDALPVPRADHDGHEKWEKDDVRQHRPKERGQRKGDRRGGQRHTELAKDCGHRFDASQHSNLFSRLPAHLS